jgi:hypothetical protein
MATKPPIGLSVVLNAANGADYVWQSDAADPGNRATGINWRTERGSGFMDGSCVLPRDVRGDYLDLRLLNAGQFVGADGSVAYEGILNIAPRSVDTGGHSITPTFIGPIALAQDEPFSEVYADRAFASWGEAPLNRKVSLTGAGRDIATLSWAVDEGLVAALPNQAVGAQSEAELWYQAPSGVNVDQVMYSGTSTTFPAGYEAPTLFAFLDDAGATGESYAETFDATLRTRSRRITLIAVYGNHGLTTRTNGTDPDALWLSDILTDIPAGTCRRSTRPACRRTGPSSSTAVYESSSPTTPARPQQVRALGTRRLGEQAAPVRARRPDRLRLGSPARRQRHHHPPGRRREEPPQRHRRPVHRGRVRQAARSPPTTTTSCATTPSRTRRTSGAARKWGEPLVLSAALHREHGDRRGTAEARRGQRSRKEAGDITIVGHVRDRAGHWRPAHEMRAGQTVALLNFPNPRPAANRRHEDKRVKTLAEELKDRTQQVRQIEQAAQHCTTEAAKWQAKYEEAKQYTAAEAVQQFEAALQAHSARVSERHEVLIQQGEATARSLGSIADVLARIESRTAPPQ